MSFVRVRPAQIAFAFLILTAGRVGAQADPRLSLDSLLSIPVHAAARYAQALSDAPAAVTVITRQEIAAFGYRTLDQVLARAAGFYTSYDRNYSYVGVRGFSRPTDYNSRVLLLLNGQVMNENVYGAAAMGTELGFDLSLLDRVEIVRGPVSSLYGTSAMFAVINLITIDPSRTSVAASVEAGSFGAFLGSGRIELASAGRSLLVGVQVGREDGQDLYYPAYADGSTRGHARDLDWTRLASAFAAARLGNLRVQARISDRDKGVPTGAWGTDFGVPGSETTDGWLQAGVTYERMLKTGVVVTATGTADRYRYRGAYPYDGVVVSDASDMNRAAAGLQVLWDMTASNRVVAGGSFTRTMRADYRTRTPGEPENAADLPYSAAGVYVQDELHLARWITLILGVRADDESRSKVHVTPRVSAILRPRPSTTVKLLYGTAFRAPSVYERVFTNDPDVPYNDLGPEQIRTYELVAEQRIGDTGIVRISLFDDEVSALIDPVTDEDDNYQFANVGSVRTRGVEGEFTMGLRSWLLNGSGILQSATDLSNDSDLSNAPSVIFRVGLNGPVRPRVEAALQGRVETGRLTVTGLRTSAVGLIDVGVTYDIASRFSVAGFLDNALDQEYAHPGGLEHRQDAIVQNGRRWRVQLRVR